MVQTQPLKGKTIVVTRPTDQADEEAAIIQRYGGTPYLFPTIKITPPTDLAPIKKFVADLEADKFDFVAFMSINGVNHFLGAAKKLGCKAQTEAGLKKAHIIAIGPRTAEELEKRGNPRKPNPNQVHIRKHRRRYEKTWGKRQISCHSPHVSSQRDFEAKT
jgi:uroporphyrinogen-III synthase